MNDDDDLAYPAGKGAPRNSRRNAGHRGKRAAGLLAPLRVEEDVPLLAAKRLAEYVARQQALARLVDHISSDPGTRALETLKPEFVCIFDATRKYPPTYWPGKDTKSACSYRGADCYRSRLARRAP